MRIWLLTIGEPVPQGFASADRLHRTGAFGQYMAQRGHDVTWWTSTFDHFRKRYLFPCDQELTTSSALRIVLLHGGGYRRNVSIARIKDHRKVADAFRRRARAELLPPDIILAALPAIELCQAAVEFGQDRAIPVVLDLRDMWPDIFPFLLPRPFRPICRAALYPLFAAARSACSRATALIGITEAFVEWGLVRARRARTPLDRAFPLAYCDAPPDHASLSAAGEYWNRQGVSRDPDSLTACFIGTLGRQTDVDTILRAAQHLHDRETPVRFVLAGTGDRVDELRSGAKHLPNVIFPGWINGTQCYSLLRRSDVGLDPLPDRFDFLATINNKAVEYLSAGLPVIASPSSGVLAELLAEERCGASYPHRDGSALADLLTQFHRNRELLANRSTNALALFAARFTSKIVYSAMEQHLKTVVDATAAASHGAALSTNIPRSA